MYKGKTRSVLEVVIYSFITCGIYSFYWVYKFAQELKFYLDDPECNPGLDLFLSIICFPYFFYWFYKYNKKLNAAQERAGLPVEDNTVLNVILAIFGLWIVSIAIMQNTANRIWEQPS